MEDCRWKSMGVRLWYVVYSATVFSIVALPVLILWAESDLFSLVGLWSAEFVGALAAGLGPFVAARVALFVVTGQPIVGWRWQAYLQDWIDSGMSKKPKEPGRLYRARKLVEREGVLMDEAFERVREQDARNPAAKKRKGGKLTPAARQARKQLVPRGKGPMSFVGGGSPGLGNKK